MRGCGLVHGNDDDKNSLKRWKKVEKEGAGHARLHRPFGKDKEGAPPP